MALTKDQIQTIVSKASDNQIRTLTAPELVEKMQWRDIQFGIDGRPTQQGVISLLTHWSHILSDPAFEQLPLEDQVICYASAYDLCVLLGDPTL